MRFPALLVLALALAPAAHAQLDLPGASRNKKVARPQPTSAPRGQTPSLRETRPVYDELKRERGTVTNEVYNSDTPAVLGFNPRTRRSSTGRQEGGLDLPSRLRRRPAGRDVRPAAADPAPTVAPAAEGAEPRRPSPSAGGVALADLRPAVQLVYAQLVETKKVDDPLIDDAAQVLAESGDDGLAAARIALDADHAPLFLAGVRALLAGGDGADGDRVVKALQRRMPGNAGAGAVRALTELDPVRSTPELLVQLLQHPQASARQAAHHALEERVDVSLLPLLVPALESRSSDVRERAIDLVMRIDHDATLELLLERLDDSSPDVSRKAVQALARLRDERTADELVRIGFEDPLPSRRQALAWLALAEREDSVLRPILSEVHTPMLLRALESADPVVSGAAAVALAGIGFRAADPTTTAWLDDEVPTHLVSVAAGVQFFDDFQTVRPPALRRLRQLAGVNHAGHGAAWARWWLEAGSGFRASRAVLPVRTEDEGALRVLVRGADTDGPFTLLGPDLTDLTDTGLAEGDGLRGEAVWLDAAQVRGLVALMREEGVFGYERLPGSRGAMGLGSRALDVRTPEGAKSFRYGAGLGEPWFDRVLDAMAALRERNRWQRFANPVTHGDRRGLYLAERDWWSADRTPGERDARHEALVLGYLEAVRPEERDEALRELARLHTRTGIASQDDVAPLLALLDQEPFFGGRAAQLVALTRGAAGIDEAVEGELEGRVAATASELISVLHDRFGPYAADEIAGLLLAQGRERVRAVADGDSGLLRGIAATVLGRDTQPADVPVLMALLDDPDPDVQVASLLAIGRAGIEDARDEVILRASFSEGAVRASALRALGALGGDGALDVLVRAMTSPDTLLHVPAAEGLAALGTPETVPYLMSMLRNGRRTETFPAARAGILAQGSEAWEDLLVALRSPSEELRREAGLLLAEQRVPQAASGLIRALAEQPDDRLVASELVVLTCVDLRDRADPAEEWFRWWDEVDRRSPMSWFRAACEARGLAAPPAEAFVGVGSREAREFLLAVIVNGDREWLAERARRELSSLAGGDLGPLPPGRDGRAEWAEAAAARLLN